MAWAVALGVTLGLAPYLSRVLFIFFWPAVLFSAWYGGFGPALLVSVLSTLAVDYFLSGPTGQVRLENRRTWRRWRCSSCSPPS